MIRVVLNGKRVELDGVRTLAELLRQRGIDPRLVAVEHNGTILPREAYEHQVIQDGDVLEVVHFVGGG